MSLSTKEIAKQIRTEVKSLGGKISTYKSYSGGSSITVAVMEAPIRLIRRMDEIPDTAYSRLGWGYTKENIKERQTEKYHQLNQYEIKDWNENAWNNGVFVTQKGHEWLKKINDTIAKYHWDKSDSQIDYFCTNFYYDIHLGKWNAPFVDGGV